MTREAVGGRSPPTDSFSESFRARMNSSRYDQPSFTDARMMLSALLALNHSDLVLVVGVVDPEAVFEPSVWCATSVSGTPGAKPVRPDQVDESVRGSCRSRPGWRNVSASMPRF